MQQAVQGDQSAADDDGHDSRMSRAAVSGGGHTAHGRAGRADIHQSRRPSFSFSSPSSSSLSSLSSLLPPPSFSTVPTPISTSIFLLLPARTKLLQLTHISHSFPALTAAAFQLDHLLLSAALLQALQQSAPLRALLSSVPSIGYCGDNELHRAFRRCFRIRPPPFPLLRCCLINFRSPLSRPPARALSARRALKRRMRLISCLTRCSQLSTLSIAGSENDIDGRALQSSLRRLPRLRSLRLDGLCLWDDALPALLSLPLYNLDLFHCKHLSFEEGGDAGPPSAGTLHTLVLPWKAATDLSTQLRSYRQHPSLLTLAIPYHYGQTHDMNEVILSQQSLTHLRLVQGHAWNVSFLLDDGRPLLPILSNFAFAPKYDPFPPPGAVDAVPPLRVFLNAYSQQLQRVELNLPSAAAVRALLVSCCHCPLLRSMIIMCNEFEIGPRVVQPPPSVSAIFPHLPLLQVLELATQIDGEDLLSLLRASPDLRRVHVRQESPATLGVSVLLPAIGASCRRIHWLRLGYPLDSNAPQSITSLPSSSSSAAAPSPLFPELQVLLMYGKQQLPSVQWLLDTVSHSPLLHLDLPQPVPAADLLLLLSSLPRLRSVYHNMRSAVPLLVSSVPVPRLITSPYQPSSWAEAEQGLSRELQGQDWTSTRHGWWRPCEWLEEDVTLAMDGGMRTLPARDAYIALLRRSVEEQMTRAADGGSKEEEQ